MWKIIIPSTSRVLVPRNVSRSPSLIGGLECDQRPINDRISGAIAQGPHTSRHQQLLDLHFFIFK